MAGQKRKKTDAQKQKMLKLRRSTHVAGMSTTFHALNIVCTPVGSTFLFL